MHKLSFLVLILVALQVGACETATPIPPSPITLKPDIPPKLAVPPILKQIVAFIYTPESEAHQEVGDKFQPSGTAFFVALKNERNPETGFIYLVTAKHAIQTENKEIFKNIAIRLNKRSGGSILQVVPLSGEGAFSVYLHPHDPDADVAVIPIALDLEIFEYKFWLPEIIPTRSMLNDNNIYEGDDVFFIGLFWQFLLVPDKNKRNIPVVRFGRVAVVTDEKIPVMDKEEIKLLDLYLIEAQSFGGNSGSPVFIYTSRGKLLLAGLISGHFSEAIYRSENVGIAKVVPAYKIYEILFSDELRAIRAKAP